MSKVVVMIHGSGVVRAGQWARRLIINEDLQKGTMLPYIKYIQDQGWGVAVLNTNHNTKHLDSKETIPGNANPEEHADTVWEEVIKPCQAEKIVIISHSYGGVVTMDLASRHQEDFLKRVCGVFMTDSVHYRLTGHQELDTKLELISKNYVTSDKVMRGRKCEMSGRLHGCYFPAGSWVGSDQRQEGRGEVLCRSRHSRVDVLVSQGGNMERSHHGLLSGRLWDWRTERRTVKISEHRPVLH